MDTHEQLHADYLAGDVCLFVGAGVSRGCGLPNWRELAEGVVRMFPRKPGPPLGATSAAIQQGQRPPPDPNILSTQKANVLAQEEPLLAMRYARSDGDLDLCSLVGRCLYRGPITRSETVLEIPLLEEVKRICCFNYDDILDRAFTREIGLRRFLKKNILIQEVGAGLIKMSYLGNAGWRSNRFSTACIAAFPSAMPFW